MTATSCISTTWLSDSSIGCVTPVTGAGVRDVHYLASGGIQNSLFNGPLEALSGTLSKSDAAGNLALTLDESVEFVNVPVNVSIITFEDVCVDVVRPCAVTVQLQMLV